MPNDVVRRMLGRCRAACFRNLGLKLVALVLAVIIYVLVHRPAEETKAPEAPTCPP